jgi:hypothetical protein
MGNHYKKNEIRWKDKLYTTDKLIRKLVIRKDGSQEFIKLMNSD